MTHPDSQQRLLLSHDGSPSSAQTHAPYHHPHSDRSSDTRLPSTGTVCEQPPTLLRPSLVGLVDDDDDDGNVDKDDDTRDGPVDSNFNSNLLSRALLQKLPAKSPGSLAMESTESSSPPPPPESLPPPPPSPPAAVTPLPKFQLFIVLLIQFAEPITATIIYPFINQFVRETGITHGDEKKTGYYAGVIESIFFVAEALTVVFWSRASDRIGRRPILLLGPVGLATAMFALGMSTTFWGMVWGRCLQGTFNGNIGVSKTVIAEITDSTNIADAYAYTPLLWSVGTTVGPLAGGMLSNPATRWPHVFERFEFFKVHPYFLPCAFAGTIAGVTAIVAFMGLKETLPSIAAKSRAAAVVAHNEVDEARRPLLPVLPQPGTPDAQSNDNESKDYGTVNRRRSGGLSLSLPLSSPLPPPLPLPSHSADASASSPAPTILSSSPDSSKAHSKDGTPTRPLSPIPISAAAAATAVPTEPEQQLPSMLTITKSRYLRIVLANHGFLAMSDMAGYVLIPLMYSTSLAGGGLGMDPYDIGTLIGIKGFVNAILQINFLSRMIRKFGARKAYIISYSSLLLTNAMYPVLRYLVKRRMAALALAGDDDNDYDYGAEAGTLGTWIWAGIVVQLCATMMVGPAYGSIQLLIIDAAPSRAELGTTNGIAQAIGCTARAFTPSFASSLFALSLERDWLGGDLVYWVIMAIVAVGIRLAILLPPPTPRS